MAPWKTMLIRDERTARSSAASTRRRSSPSRSNLAPDDAAARRQEAEEGEGRRRLPASRLADEAEGLAAREPEGDAVDGAHRARRRLELDRQVAHLEQGGRLGGGSHERQWREGPFARLEVMSPQARIDRILEGGPEERRAEHHPDDRETGRQERPPCSGAHGPAVEREVEHLAPADPEGVAEPDEGEGRLLEDREADDEDRVGRASAA